MRKGMQGVGGDYEKRDGGGTMRKGMGGDYEKRDAGGDYEKRGSGGWGGGGL